MQRAIFLVLGKQGAGKSTFLFNRLVPLCSAPCFILDTMNDVKYGVHYGSTEDVVSAYYDGQNYSGVYVLRAESNSESELFMKCVYMIAQERGGEGLKTTLVVDEIDKFCSVYQINETLDNIVRYGRRHGINLLGAARRTSEVHTQIRAQVDCIVSFKQDIPKDIKALQERDPNAYIVSKLNIFRETGQESEFFCVGEFPSGFESLSDLKSHKKTNEL